MTQPELFTPVSHGNLVVETPVVGRITQLFDHGVAASRMHSGNLSTSKRLKDTLAVLQDGQWHTTREIRLVTFSEAVHSDIAGLRANGIEVESECGEGRVWKYRVVA